MADKETHAKEIITIESSDEDEPRSPSDISQPASLLPQGSESAAVIGAKRRASSPSKSSKKAKHTPSLQYLESSVHLTSVERAPPSHNIGCFTLESLIGDPDLELMVQINFMIDVDFVMKRVHESIRDGLRTIVYHGLRMTADQLLNMNTRIYKQYPRVDIRRVQVSGIGTHHTKAMMLFYTDNTMQLIVHTANMIPRDWRNKTQALFTTGRLQTKALSASGLSTCAFERDLLEYLRHYENHQEIVSRVAQFDFQSVKGVLVASVPGKFSSSEKNKWGHLKLRSVLRLQAEIPRECVIGSQIICQISSIGSLGKSSQDWLRGEFETSLNAHRNANYLPQNKGDLCVVFPTAEDVRTSHEGWSMGGSIPFKSTSYNKQAQYLNPILHSWAATKSGRDRAMPHVKTYTRVSRRADGDYISWFLLTSSNLSKPAWGELKDGALAIKSFELGVLIFPGLFESSNVDLGTESEGLHVFMMNATVDNPYPEPSRVPYTEPQAKDADGNEFDKRDQLNVGVVPVRLPFDLPLRKYNFDRDQVWLIDKAFPGVDDFGETCRP